MRFAPHQFVKYCPFSKAANVQNRRQIHAKREHFIAGTASRRPLGRNEVSLFAGPQQSNHGWNCATLVILVDLPSSEAIAETWVLLTHRAAKMRKHANEISLPGGTIEKGESAEDAALREAEEEIGLKRRNLEIWGHLPAPYFREIKGKTTPFVARFIGNAELFESQLRPEKGEVQGIFLVQLRELVDRIRFTAFRIPGRLKDGLPMYYRMPAFNVEEFQLLCPSINEEYLSRNRLIWGLTAITLHEALLSILPDQDPNRQKILPT